MIKYFSRVSRPRSPPEVAGCCAAFRRPERVVLGHELSLATQAETLPAWAISGHGDPRTRDAAFQREQENAAEELRGRGASRDLRLSPPGGRLGVMALSIVTGSNRGIGLSLVRLLAQRGETVLAACRKTSPELDAFGVEVATDVDVATPDGVEHLVRAVAGRPIGLVINNAGILVWGDKLESPDYAGISRQFEVNAVGPLRVTSALLPNLQAGAKVAVITSRMGSIGDNGSGGAYGYRMSKAALNIAAVSMARDLQARDIAVAILHPGMVKTDMIGAHNGQVEPDDAARGLLARIDELTVATSGGFWHQNGERLPW